MPDLSDDEAIDVFVVEDNPGDVRLIEEGLASASVETSTTVMTDGGEALDFVTELAADEEARGPHLTVLDIDMPQKDGRAILRIINETPHLRSRVLILSGSDASEQILDTYALGADGYFVKPTDADTFLSIIRRAAETVADTGTVPIGEFSTYETGG